MAKKAARRAERKVAKKVATTGNVIVFPGWKLDPYASAYYGKPPVVVADEGYEPIDLTKFAVHYFRGYWRLGFEDGWLTVGPELGNSRSLAIYVDESDASVIAPIVTAYAAGGHEPIIYDEPYWREAIEAQEISWQLKEGHDKLRAHVWMLEHRGVCYIAKTRGITSIQVGEAVIKAGFDDEKIEAALDALFAPSEAKSGPVTLNAMLGNGEQDHGMFVVEI